MDEFILSRLQFAVNITFHILFPTITIALGWFLVFFKLRYQRTGDEKWMELYFYFTKVFALTFSLGVVTGVSMSFQFGTNWPGFMHTIGNVAGPLLAYEVMTAFFMEATFLGIMLYAFRRVPQWFHTLATFLVALGTTFSAFWILALNSWMHTPAGFEIVDGIVHVVDWWKVVFNPSMPYRLVHMLLASVLTSAFLVAGLLSYRWLKGDRCAAVRSGLKFAIVVMAIVAPLQGFAGDAQGENTRRYQPAKLAAMEALWNSGTGVPMLLFAIPDEQKRENTVELGIPRLGSLIITRNPNGYVQGLNDFGDMHPKVAPVFWSFRVMVGMGMLMVAVAFLGVFLHWKKKCYPRWYMRVLCGMTFSGWVAVIAGWYVTEIGRQPWLVQGVLLAKDAVAELPPKYVALTLTGYVVAYAILMVAYVVTLFYMTRVEVKKQLLP